MANRTAYRSPTPAEYEVVRKVWKETGILTVKDPVTAEWLKPAARCGGTAWEKPWQERPEYGAEYRPNPVGGNAHEVGFAAQTRHIRAVFVENIGTDKLPLGVAIGGCEVWVSEDVFGQRPPQCVRWQPDIAPDEETRLSRWARGIVHVTQEMFDAAENESRHRAARGLATQVDPVGALVPALAEAFKQVAHSGPTAEQLAAAGFYQDPATGQWQRRESNAVGAVRK